MYLYPHAVLIVVNLQRLLLGSGYHHRIAGATAGLTVAVIAQNAAHVNPFLYQKEYLVIILEICEQYLFKGERKKFTFFLKKKFERRCFCFIFLT